MNFPDGSTCQELPLLFVGERLLDTLFIQAALRSAQSGLALARWRGIAPTSSVGFAIESIMDCRVHQDDFANFIVIKQ